MRAVGVDTLVEFAMVGMPAVYEMEEGVAGIVTDKLVVCIEVRLVVIETGR